MSLAAIGGTSGREQVNRGVRRARNVAGLQGAFLGAVLSQKGLQGRLVVNRLVDLGIAAHLVGTDADQLRHVLEGREQGSRPADGLVLRLAVAVRHAARNAAQDIDGGKAVTLGDSSVQDDVAVEDAAHRIGHRFVVIVALDQHAEEAGDRPAVDTGARRAPGVGAARQRRTAYIPCWPGARPADRPISRSAMAKRVIESIRQSTSRPRSRKYSASVMVRWAA